MALDQAKTDTLENEFLNAVFKNTNLPASDPLYVSLHTADPGESGSQTTNETTYTNYARVAVALADWDVTASVASNVNEILFPASGGASADINFYGIGRSPTGAGTLLYRGDLSAALPIGTGTEPKFPPGNLTVEEQ